MLRNVLIIYGTTDGHTRKVAEALAQAVRAEGVSADVIEASSRRARGLSAASYDAVIVAASVHIGGYQRGVRRWVTAHAKQLDTRPSAFLSVCLGVLEHNPKTDRDIEAIMARFFARTGWMPKVRKVVAGALPYTKYNFIKRWMMRRIVAKAGGDTDTSRDYEYTDWNDLRSFARDFVRAYRRILVGVPIEAA
jgi:menaquinone-dependent protoporphyrinogen oxidase